MKLQTFWFPESLVYSSRSSNWEQEDNCLTN